MADALDEVAVVLRHIEIEQVVVDLDVLVVLERELHREVAPDGVVIDPAALTTG